MSLLVAPNGHGRMSDFSPLSGVKRKSVFGAVCSAFVQVFGRRDAETIPTLGQPASEKRQGTKSRGVGHRQCSGCYGDLASAGVLGKLSRRWRSDRFSLNLGRACWRERADWAL